MRISYAAVLFAMLSASALALSPAWPQETIARAEAPVPPYRLIVNNGVAHSQLARDFVADAFLRKASHWPQGAPIRPVDQDSDSAVRRKFSSEVLHRSVAAVRSYWQQLIFSGRGLPPPELDSDQEVVRYVARNGGAIGYVSDAADVGGVKVVTVE